MCAQNLEGSTLEGEWRFARDLDDVGLTEQWQAPDFDDSAWELKEVPADWGDFDGIGWYRLTTDLPTVEDGVGLYLVFAGVDDVTKVWANGELVAECNAWNRRFYGDVTAMAGETVEIAVRVEDHGGGGGIYKPVTLVATADQADLVKSEWHDRPVIETPDWLEGSVIYEVFPRHFSPTADFEGVRQRLDELHDLGVDVIWLMPIHPLGIDQRKGTVGSPYAMRDHMAINPDYGTAEDLRNLVNDAHERGMRVIIDAVLNHSSPDGVLTQDHLDWYDDVNEDGIPQADNPDWWDIADFDWENPEVRDYFFNMMEYWVREFDIDGYRCDVASLMPIEFWEELLPRLQAIKPDVMMLAEADEPAHHRASFHISYNWTLYDALVPVMKGDMAASHLGNALIQDQMNFQRGALRMPFSENHDKERGENVFGSVEAAKAATIIALTVAECPLIYSGQEVGENAMRDIFETIPIDWSDPHGFRPLIKSITALRDQSEALRLGTTDVLTTSDPDNVFAFVRTHGDEMAVVATNVSSGEVAVTVEGHAIDGPGGLGLATATQGAVTLPPHTGDVWIIKPE